MKTSALIALTAVLLLLAVALPAQDAQKVLFLTQSAGFKHGVVDRKNDQPLSLAEAMLQKALRGRFEVACTQDAAVITAATLSQYRAVVFYTTGELPMTEADQAAFLEWIKNGGAFIGIHSATDTFYKWPAYGDLVGGYFNGHPWTQKVRVKVDDRGHPASAPFGDGFEIDDEIYQFKDWSRDRVHVLLSIDPASVDVSKGAREDRDYAVAWCRPYGKGRSFFTSLGHRPEVWRDARFLAHLVAGIQWAIDGQPAGVPPSGAVVLFDGKDASRWVHRDGKPFAWAITGGAMEIVPGTGDVVTAEKFQDFRLHVEFMVPVMPPDVRGQARGNSGVYLQGRHELQVLDSFGLELSDGDCGAIYGRKVPDLNASLEPGMWQTYDVNYTGARWSADGKKTANARMTVWQNGLLIHQDVEVDGGTRAGMDEAPGPGPVLLQDHGCRVRYRNLWLVPR